MGPLGPNCGNEGNGHGDDIGDESLSHGDGNGNAVAIKPSHIGCLTTPKLINISAEIARSTWGDGHA
jgi:hypothetical protein